MGAEKYANLRMGICNAVTLNLRYVYNEEFVYITEALEFADLKSRKVHVPLPDLESSRKWKKSLLEI